MKAAVQGPIAIHEYTRIRELFLLRLLILVILDINARGPHSCLGDASSLLVERCLVNLRVRDEVASGCSQPR